MVPLRKSINPGTATEKPSALAVAAICSYISFMRFTWSERKRAINLKDHGLDFVDAPRVFEGATYTFEDDRFDYGEQRYETLGLLAGVPVSIVHTETEDEIRVISFRKATKREAKLYFQQVQD
jgi:hypothetical protein